MHKWVTIQCCFLWKRCICLKTITKHSKFFFFYFWFSVHNNSRSVRLFKSLSPRWLWINYCLPFYFLFSHDKNACNDVSGTTKQKAALASLQRPISDQILIALQLFKFCKKNIPSIKYFCFLWWNYLTDTFLWKKVLIRKCIPDTCDNHCFIQHIKTHKFSCISTFDDILMLCLCLNTHKICGWP